MKFRLPDWVDDWLEAIALIAVISVWWVLYKITP